jgi:hypothetical protein
LFYGEAVWRATIAANLGIGLREREDYTAVRLNTQSFWFGSLIVGMVDGPYRLYMYRKKSVVDDAESSTW